MAADEVSYFFLTFCGLQFKSLLLLQNFKFVLGIFDIIAFESYFHPCLA